MHRVSMASPSLSETPDSFAEADRMANLPVVPSSSNSTKVVVLGAKQLKTVKEVRTVLPEEKYLEGLQDIIVRDYFPELPKLKAQKEYLDAVASNDLTKIRELQQRYSTRRTERRTSPTARRSPDLFDPETPGPSSRMDGLPPDSQRSSICNPAGDNEVSNRKKGSQLSVDVYLNKFTSEDNASFEELAALHNKKERIRNSWMYEAEEKHNKELVYRAKEMLRAADEQLMIAAAPSGQEDKPKDLDNWAYKARNSVLFNVDEVPLTVEEHIKRQKMNQRIINKEATRLPIAVYTETNQGSMARAAMQQAVTQAGKVDVTGQEMGVVKASTLGLVATPSPAPGVDESPFMTWGEIEGTPFRLDGSDMLTPGIESAPAFKIPEVPIREQIAQGITEQIAKTYRDKRKAAIRQAEKLHSKTPSFGSVRSSERLLLMSPAARRLATKGLGIRLGSDKSLKASYTPSPRRPSTMRATPTSDMIVRKSPYIRPVVKEVSSDAATKAQTSITDNLLNFGETAPSKSSRPTAADFF